MSQSRSPVGEQSVDVSQASPISGRHAEDLKELMRSKEAEHILLGLTRSMVDVAQKEARDEDNKNILGNSAQIAEVHLLVRRAAATDSTVMILGENGTGKELVARAIHEGSARREGPFVAVNCGALPEALLESELFGYEKGAFTGADTTKPGRFELAEGGTLFLDEIGDLAPVMQVKLLRVLQEHSYERLGSSESRKANVRIITATHRDLPAMMGEGKFREDLYYRLYVIPIAVPPLRERGSDIDLLAGHFLLRFSRINRKRFKQISPAAMKALRAHSWPGNVRELENTLERAVAIYDDEVLRREYLEFSASSRPASSQPFEVSRRAESWDAVAQAERGELQKSLRQAGFKDSQAARDAGLSRATFYRKMEKYHIRLKDLN
jgi:transcriptional regulator with PAS, ATPase and Fis domain